MNEFSLNEDDAESYTTHNKTLHDSKVLSMSALLYVNLGNVGV